MDPRHEDWSLKGLRTLWTMAIAAYNDDQVNFMDCSALGTIVGLWGSGLKSMWILFVHCMDLEQYVDVPIGEKHY